MTPIEPRTLVARPSVAGGTPAWPPPAAGARAWRCLVFVAVALRRLALAARTGATSSSVDRPPGRRPARTTCSASDQLGRDVFSRVLIGAEPSLRVGARGRRRSRCVAGVAFGLLAGFYRGWLDDVVMRCMDMLFAFPAILLAIAILAIRGRGATNAMIAIGIVYTPIFARVTRASVLERPRGGLRAGRPVGRRRRPAHHAPPRAAQRGHADHRADVDQPGLRHPGRGGAVVHRPRHPAARAVVGIGCWPTGAASSRTPGGWRCSPAWPSSSWCSGVQRAGRRPARRPRPPPALGHRVGARGSAGDRDAARVPVDRAAGPRPAGALRHPAGHGARGQRRVVVGRRRARRSPSWASPAAARA